MPCYPRGPTPDRRPDPHEAIRPAFASAGKSQGRPTQHGQSQSTTAPALAAPPAQVTTTSAGDRVAHRTGCSAWRCPNPRGGSHAADCPWRKASATNWRSGKIHRAASRAKTMRPRKMGKCTNARTSTSTPNARAASHRGDPSTSPVWSLTRRFYTFRPGVVACSFFLPQCVSPSPVQVPDTAAPVPKKPGSRTIGI